MAFLHSIFHTSTQRRNATEKRSKFPLKNRKCLESEKRRKRMFSIIINRWAGLVYWLRGLEEPFLWWYLTSNLSHNILLIRVLYIFCVFDKFGQFLICPARLQSHAFASIVVGQTALIDALEYDESNFYDFTIFWTIFSKSVLGFGFYCMGERPNKSDNGMFLTLIYFCQTEFPIFTTDPSINRFNCFCRLIEFWQSNTAMRRRNSAGVCFVSSSSSVELKNLFLIRTKNLHDRGYRFHCSSSDCT